MIDINKLASAVAAATTTAVLKVAQTQPPPTKMNPRTDAASTANELIRTVGEPGRHHIIVKILRQLKQKQ